MENVNPGAVNFVGGEPAVVTTTAPTIETVEAPTPAPVKPAKPNVFERLGLVRAKKTESDRAAWARLLRKQNAGHDLKDAEIVLLDDVMVRLGFSDADLNEHKDKLRRHDQAIEAAKKMPAMMAAQKEAGEAYEAFGREQVDPVMLKWGALKEEWQARLNEFSSARAAANGFISPDGPLGFLLGE